MIIFKDVFSGDEIFSDTYKYKLVDDIIYEVTGKTVSRKVDDVVLAGSNPSEEEQDEGTVEAVESGVDIVLNHRLVETGFSDKKQYLTTLKGYMKAVLAKLEKDAPDQVDIFKTNIVKFTKDITAADRFKDLQFFIGENMDENGMIALMEYRDIAGESVPTLMVFKHGVVAEKF